MANLNLSEFTEKLFVADADHTFIWDTAASISKRVSRNSWLNSGTLTSDAPVTISQTWGTTGTYTAAKVNVTETATANAASLLLDLQLGSVSRVKVNKEGNLVIAAVSGAMIQCTASSQGVLSSASAFPKIWGARFDFQTAAGGTTMLGIGPTQVEIPTQLVFNTDTILLRDGAGQLALRNGAAAQTFNVYGTSSASNANYARLALTCGLDGNATISTQALGTGTAGTVSINGVPVGLGKGNVSSNIAIGTNALNANSSGISNTFVGFGSGQATVATQYNTGVGESVLQNLNGGGRNTAIGAWALRQLTGGFENIAIGVTAGNLSTTGNFTSGDNNIFIGGNSKGVNAQNNQVVIGYDATGIGSNSVVLGNDSITKTALKGNVGIGTTAPSRLLSVVGNLIGANLMLLNNTNSAGYTELGFDNDTAFAGNLGGFVFGLSGTTTPTPNDAYFFNRRSAAIFFGTNSTERMRITGAGNVGIGTTAPSEKLHVLGGKILVGDPTDITGASVNGELTVQAWRTPQLNLVANTNSSNFFGLSLKAGAAERAGLLVNMQSGEVKMGALGGSGYFPTFWSNGVEIMRFSTAGNVGIGTTSPTSKLHVAGNSSPSITVDNTIATGASQLLFKNTVVTGDTDGIFLNGSAQSGFGGNGSLNIKATTGPLAFHTNTVTNALSIAQNGVATFAISIAVNSAVRTSFINNIGDSLSMFNFVNDSTGTSTYAVGGSAPLMRFGGTTTSFPAIKRSATTLQIRLANDSDFAPIQGKLTTETAFTATTVVPTGFITLYDSTGTAYKVPCVQA